MLKNLLCFMFLRPSGLYTRLRAFDMLPLAVFLQVFRWESTALTTVVSLYQENSPMLLPVPFGIDPQSYRFFEIFAYGPYGLVIISTLSYFIWQYGRSHAVISIMTYRRTWTLVGFCFFGPWIPSLLIDSFLVKLGWGSPEVIIPWHITIVVIESILTVVGLNAVFGIPLKRSIHLGAGAGLLFLLLAGAVIR
ncbi:MAG: hypothetical protein HQL72_01480 [Magnetococcales bacterium]|nr:hypothetical protein [Magnetococcales bacterium]